MRIFHNETTHQVVIVNDNLAYSFYCYTQDNPVTSAKEYLKSEDGLKSMASACEEIKLPQTEPTEPTQIIEKPTDSIGQIPKPNTKGRPKCEPSQKKNNKP